MSQTSDVQNSDANPIFDIIQSLQEKLNDTPKKEISQNTNVNNKEDLSKLDLSNILNLLSGNSQSSNLDKNKQQNDISNINLDINTIMKFQRIFSSINQADPRKNLLLSLKPFLRETRQKNVDTYITILGILNILNNLGKDSD